MRSWSRRLDEVPTPTGSTLDRGEMRVMTSGFGWCVPGLTPHATGAAAGSDPRVNIEHILGSTLAFALLQNAVLRWCFLYDHNFHFISALRPCLACAYNVVRGHAWSGGYEGNRPFACFVFGSQMCERMASSRCCGHVERGREARRQRRRNEYGRDDDADSALGAAA
jgi:hypothetical protein